MDKLGNSKEALEVIKEAYDLAINVDDDFDVTKENLIKMTSHLDKLELTYNTLLKEYQTRNVVQK